MVLPKSGSSRRFWSRPIDSLRRQIIRYSFTTCDMVFE